MSQELKEMYPNQIKYIFDKLHLLRIEYKKKLDIELDKDDVFENECEYTKHNQRIELLDKMCLDLDNLTNELFRGM